MEALGLSDVRGVLKVGDTVSDIREGKNAGVTTFGVVIGSSEMGLSREEYESLSEEEQKQRCEQVAEKFLAAGADPGDFKSGRSPKDRVKREALAEPGKNAVSGIENFTISRAGRFQKKENSCLWDSDRPQKTEYCLSGRRAVGQMQKIKRGKKISELFPSFFVFCLFGSDPGLKETARKNI